MSTLSRINLNRFILLGITSLLAVLLGFVLVDYANGVSMVRAAIYPLLFITFAAFLYFGCSIAMRYRQELRKAYLSPVALLSIFGITALTMINQPLGYKTVMDEIVLAGTARQLHMDREPLTPHKALYGRNHLVVSNAYLDKRPVFFPFLVSLVHDATGYRPVNAFYLNCALTLLVLTIIWGVGFTIGGTWAALFGTVMMATLPLIPMLGSGGGFEMANLLWILFFFIALWAVFKNTDKISISFLLLTTVLLAHLRYESALFVPFTGLAILWAWWMKGKIVIPWILIITPLLLIDIPLQHKVFQENEAFWQLKDVEGAETVFSLDYVPANLGHALNYFLSTENYMPNTIPLFLLGFVGLILTALLLRSWSRGLPSERAAAILWLSLLLQAIVLMTYFWGRLDDTIIHRLSLPLWLWLWIGMMYLLRRPLSNRKSGFPLCALAILFAVTFTLPLYSKAEYSKRHAPPEVFNRLSEWAENNQDGRTLILSKNSVFWITENFAAMNIATPEKDLPFLKRIINHGIYSTIYVAESTQFDPDLEEYVADETGLISDAIQREEIFHYAVDRMFGFRISKVISVNYEIPEGLVDEEEFYDAAPGEQSLHYRNEKP